MFLFTIPPSIAAWLGKDMRDFVQNTNDNGNGLHWVNRDEVCRSKKEEGVGIRPLHVIMKF